MPEWTPESNTTQEWTPDVEQKPLEPPPSFKSEAGKLLKWGTTSIMPDVEEGIGNFVQRAPYVGSGLRKVSDFITNGATSPLGLATLGIGTALGGKKLLSSGARALEGEITEDLPNAGRKLLGAGKPQTSFINGPAGTVPNQQIGKLDPSILAREGIESAMHDSGNATALGKLMPITDESGRMIAPPQSVAQPRPAGPWDTNSGVKPNAEGYQISIPKSTISNLTKPHDAVLKWARGQNAASLRGFQAQQEFADLTDPKLVEAFQQGNRQGKLKDVQNFLDELFNKEKTAGLLTDEQYRENYMRQYWDYDKSSPEAVKVFESRGIPKEAGFTKDRTFETYKQGIEAGMVPKYDSIPEIIGARVAEGARALKNRELFDYLKSNNWLKEGAKVNKPTEWAITGPHKEEISKLLNNYLNNDRPFKMLGDAGSLAKNVYLSGGIPGTKYNIHAYNLAKSDIGIAGFGPGLKELLTDATGKKSIAWFNDLEPARKALLPELVEHGYTFHPMEDMGVLHGGDKLIDKVPGKTGEVVRKGMKTIEDLFEAPGFARAFPVLKFKRAEQMVDKLVAAGMDRESALSSAAQIANENFGGIEKSLRNKSYNDMSRFSLIAPDWMEAKIKQAVNDWKSAGKVVMGNGNPADKLRATSLARRGTIPAAGLAGSAAYGKLTGKSERETIPIPLGDNAYYPTMGTADEAYRPISIGTEMAKGNVLAPLKTEIGNRVSPLLKAPYNIGVSGRDDVGRPLVDKKSLLKTAGNIAGEATRPIQHQGLVALQKYLRGEISFAEATAMGLELPVGFRK